MDGDEADEAMDLAAEYVPPEEPVDDTPDDAEAKNALKFRHGSFMEQNEAASSPFISHINSLLKTDLVDIRIPIQ